MAGQPVRVSQRRHAFTFGCTGFEAIPLANDELIGEDRQRVAVLYDRWLELFNGATLPFYWAGFEPRRGAPDTHRLQATARWFVDRDVAVKGHPLCWHTETARWLSDLTTDEIAAAQVARIWREVEDFRGLIDAWDVINEVVIMPVFDRYDNGITRLARETAAGSRTVQLGVRRGPCGQPDGDAPHQRLRPVRRLRAPDRGLPRGRRHDRSDRDEDHTCTRATGARSGRSSCSTATPASACPCTGPRARCVSGELMPPEIVDLNDHQVDEWPTTPDGEARQADEVERHYRTLVGHPAVAAITWWGLPDGGWLNAPSGLVRLDGSVKPAYESLYRLIKGEWWLAPTELRTDDVRPRPLRRVPRNVRGGCIWAERRHGPRRAR